jgi:hypothetical protein
MNISFWDGPKNNPGRMERRLRSVALPLTNRCSFLSRDRAWEVARIVWVDADIVRIGLAMDEKP